MKTILMILLLVNTIIFASTPVLTSGNTISGIANKNTFKTYKIHAYAGQTVDISLHHMDADGDMYVNLDSPPTVMSKYIPIVMDDITILTLSSNRLNASDVSKHTGKTNEHSTILLSKDRDIYISVYAENCIENVQYKLTATVSEPSIETLLSGNRLEQRVVNKNSYKYYKIHVSKGDTVTVDLTNMDADGDLYVNIGLPALKNRNTCKSTHNADDYTDTTPEQCVVTLDHDDTVYISVYAQKCIHNVYHDIVATVTHGAAHGDYPPMDDGKDGIVSGYGAWGVHTFTQKDEDDEEVKIKSTILKPNSNGKKPVVFFISGAGPNYDNYSKLCEFIASKGNVVVFIHYYDSMWKNTYYSSIYEKIKQIIDHNSDIIDTHKIGLMGHSVGSNVALWLGKKLYHDDNLGDNGRFISIFAPSYNWVTLTELHAIPSDTKLIITQGANDEEENPKIAATLISEARNIPTSEKALIFVYSEGDPYLVNHGMSYTNEGNYNMLDALVFNRTTDALMDYTFNHNAQAKATTLLGRDNDAKVPIISQAGVSIDLRAVPYTNDYYKILNSYGLKQDTGENCDNVFDGSNEDQDLLDVCNNNVGI